jgi:hypothetical protein
MQEKIMLKTIGRTIGDGITLVAVAGLTAGVGTIVAFNIASSIVPTDDPLWVEARCLAGISFSGDEACFEKKL